MSSSRPGLGLQVISKGAVGVGELLQHSLDFVLRL